MKQFENISLNENESESLPADTAVLDNPQEDLACCGLMHDEEVITEEVVVDIESADDTDSEEALQSQDHQYDGEKADLKKDKKSTSQYEMFLSEYEKASSVESKLQLTMDFMELSLAQTGSPNFKSFWDARNICLQLFKENISQTLRAEMWSKYTEISKEARRLKEILDEQSSFAAEQIEIAIQALETDLNQIEQTLEKASPVDFGIESKSFGDRYNYYDFLQRELNLLNTQASRINALRKELIRTEMRIKMKNKFFQRLSVIGDKVFPRRKELIKELSEQFSADIDAFILEYFAPHKIEDALFFLREEIKALQGLAKLLTLNTHSFTHTRMRLSDCWDQLKVVEKERKKERAEQKAHFKENVTAVLEKIQAFNENFAKGETSVNDANAQLDEVAKFMRNVELGRDEVRFLREEMNLARKPVHDLMNAAENERLALEAQKEIEKRKLVDELKNEVDQLLEQAKSYDAEKIVSEQTALLEKVTSSRLNKIERNDLEKRLKSLKDLINDKKEQAMMSLSDDDKQALVQLNTVLNQRKERRQEIKTQLDNLRKANGSSGFDFEQAMKTNEMINEEKLRFAKMDVGVKEIEDLIAELKRKVRN